MVQQRGGGFWRLNKEAPPFITKESVKFIEKRIKPEDNVLEFGSGGSTVWFARRANKVVSFESGGYIIRPNKFNRSLDWYLRLKKKMTKEKIENVELYLLHSYPRTSVVYERLINSFPDEYFKWVFIDGTHRNLCIDLCRSKIIKDGFMIIDNYDHIPKMSKKDKGNMKRYMEFEHCMTSIRDLLGDWEKHVFDEDGWAGDGTIIFRKT